jgi:DtxR family Mn-dependent transcriptional regulator
MESTRNYLRAIYNLTSEGEGTASTSEVAKALDVSDASASEAIQKLEDENLVCRAPYKEFTLSPMGKEQGEKLARKHDILKEFFKDIGVEDPEKEADAAEHAISIETAEKIEKQREQ